MNWNKLGTANWQSSMHRTPDFFLDQPKKGRIKELSWLLSIFYIVDWGINLSQAKLMIISGSSATSTRELDIKACWAPDGCLLDACQTPAIRLPHTCQTTTTCLPGAGRTGFFPRPNRRRKDQTAELVTVWFMYYESGDKLESGEMKDHFWRLNYLHDACWMLLDACQTTTGRLPDVCQTIARCQLDTSKS